MTSIGMSNTEMEFGTFIESAHNDPQINSQIVLVNGAAGGSVIERWVDPANPYYAQTWGQLDTKIMVAGLTDAQMQVVWVKVTQRDYQPNFPQDMISFQSELEELARLLKIKFPNLKITYFSSRTRSFSYLHGLSPEPTAFENGFAVRWMIEKQIHGDLSLNFDSTKGPVLTSYITWGPYLWIDGYNTRSDGRSWPLTDVDPGDCTHPSSAGQLAVVEMLMEFFKSDTTANPWFLKPGVVTPTSPPPTTPTSTISAVPSSTATQIPILTSTSTQTPIPTMMPISSWCFGANVVADDLNSCAGCANNGATWFTPSIISGGYSFNSTNASLNLGGFPYLNSKPAFTVSVWVRPNFDQNSGTTRYVFSDGNNIQLFYLNQIKDWRVSVRTVSGTFRVDTQGLTWSPNTWHLLTVTYNGAEVRLYWDGLLANSMATSGAVYGDSGATIVGNASTGGSYFSGAIDELRVFASALSPSEVYNMFASPLYTPTPTSSPSPTATFTFTPSPTTVSIPTLTPSPISTRP